VLEGLMGLAAGAGHLRTRTGPKDSMLRKARVCYNHLAGDMGTQLFDKMIARRLLNLRGDELTLTRKGTAFARDFGIDVNALRAAKAPLCRECLDWSKRRSHLAGSLGRALLVRFEELGWARCDRKTRVVTFSKTGERHFSQMFADAG
jgi:hypothetical protein